MKFYNNIDFLQFAYDQGYTKEDRSKRSVAFTTLKNPSTGDSIRIAKKYKPMQYNNNDPMLSQDRGNIVNFALNRCLDSSLQVVAHPDKKQLFKAIAYLEAYDGTITPDFKKASFEPLKKKNSGPDVKILLKNLVAPNTTDPDVPYTANYLEKVRGIDPGILEEPLFKGKIMESPVQMANAKVIGNIAFVKTDMNNTPTGFVLHYHSKKEGSNKKMVYELHDAIWKSNKMPKATNLIVGESSIDCLSHFQWLKNGDKKPADNIVYASLEGHSSTQKLDDLFKLYQKIGQGATLTTITDNDYNGSHYDLNIALHFNNKLNPDNQIEILQKEHYNRFLFHGNTDIDTEKLKADMSQFIRLELPQKHALILPYLNIGKTKDFTFVEIPRIKEGKKELYKFLKPLISTIFKVNKIPFYFHKSQAKDWNDQLIAFKKKSGVKKKLKNSL